MSPLNIIILVLAILVLTFPLGGCAISTQYSVYEGKTVPCGWVAQTYLGKDILALQYFKPC